MGFRQEKSINKEWKAWLDLNQAHLMNKCGIPICVLESRNSWDYFLEHQEYSSDYSSGYSEINVDDLPSDNAMNLCLFLENEIDSKEFCCTLNRLQYLLKRGKHKQ